MTGFLLGVAAVVVTLIQISTFFEPQEQGTGALIGEIAADIRQSAERAMRGEPAPGPEPAGISLGLIVTVGALVVAGIAVILGGIGLYRNEPHRPSYMAVGFGSSAFVLHFAFWLAVLICGIVLLTSIIRNLDGILGN
ncbi:hypothetical protein HMH01_06655 [Halovulum dunhuangense]|uniref:Uncharacterized protein n=2 Tax=Halovulum dunhuangense TaxID=1505036 RepID=A0A849L1I0_9RHOB|nr:hypothetical protein [Halovulum dunhuangense]